MSQNFLLTFRGRLGQNFGTLSQKNDPHFGKLGARGGFWERNAKSFEINVTSFGFGPGSIPNVPNGQAPTPLKGGFGDDTKVPNVKVGSFGLGFGDVTNVPNVNARSFGFGFEDVTNVPNPTSFGFGFDDVTNAPKVNVKSFGFGFEHVTNFPNAQVTSFGFGFEDVPTAPTLCSGFSDAVDASTPMCSGFFDVAPKTPPSGGFDTDPPSNVPPITDFARDGCPELTAIPGRYAGGGRLPAAYHATHPAAYPAAHWRSRCPGRPCCCQCC